MIFISIHAPRAGGDNDTRVFISGNPISIHAPRAGGDSNAGVDTMIDAKFQSTPPVRGATVDEYAPSDWNYISIHAPRAGGDRSYFVNTELTKDFNPRPPCGGRLEDMPKTPSLAKFQSTPPVRGATVKIRIFIRIFK